MGSSILSEVEDTSILRTGLSTCYWRPLGRLPASRLRPPRSGLERSDFVHWPEASGRCLAAIRPELGVKPTCQDGPTDAIDPSEARCLGPRRTEVREKRTG